MADLLKRELGLAEVELTPGGRGEFSVRVNEQIVAQKNGRSFPEEPEVLAAVRAALEE